MSPTAHKIEEEFRSLGEDERMLLHARLTTILIEDERTGELTPEWREELNRRVDDVMSGREQGVDAFAVLDSLRTKFTT